MDDVGQNEVTRLLWKRSGYFYRQIMDRGATCCWPMETIIQRLTFNKQSGALLIGAMSIGNLARILARVLVPSHSGNGQRGFVCFRLNSQLVITGQRTAIFVPIKLKGTRASLQIANQFEFRIQTCRRIRMESNDFGS